MINESLQPIPIEAAIEIKPSRRLTLKIVDRLKSLCAHKPHALLSNEMESWYMPALPRGFELDNLFLKLSRTRACLSEAGFLTKPEKLEQQSVKDLMRISRFGVKCLADLLTALEPFIAGAACRAAASSPVARFATRFAKGSTDYPDSTREALQSEINQLIEIIGRASVAVNDPRLGTLVRAVDNGARSARDACARQLAGCHRSQDPKSIVESLRRLRCEIERVSHLTLEEELWEMTSVLNSERHRLIAVRRLGWDGRGTMTFKATGAEFGVTFEFVRQVCAEITNFHAGRVPFAPALDRAIQLIADYEGEDESAQLRKQEITRGTFDLRGLQTAIATFGRKPPARTHRKLCRREEQRIVRISRGEIIRDVIEQEARSLARQRGAVQTECVTLQARRRLAAKFKEGNPPLVADDEVIAILREVPGWYSLNAESAECDWFCFDSIQESYLHRALKSALGVARRISLDALYAAVERAQCPPRRPFPPAEVLLTLARTLNWCCVKGKMVSAAKTLDPVETLTPAEAILVRVFTRNHRPLRRAELRVMCEAEGIKLGSFYHEMSYSPIIKRCAHDSYTLLNASDAFVARRGRPQTKRGLKPHQL